ncbi:MAG: hypothetical protein AAFY13_03375 [Pseudomonadota bacterium]
MQFCSRAFVLIFAGAVIGSQAGAQVSTSDEAPATLSDFVACKPITDPAQRLACLDSALGRTVATGPVSANSGGVSSLVTAGGPDEAMAEAQTTISAPPRSFAPAAENNFGLSAEQVLQKKRPDSQTAQTVSISRTKSGKYVIVLENGQIWRQLKADTNRLFVRDDGAGAVAVIKKRSLGSHALSLEGSKRSIKVKRIK